ncbi:hypothetical protein CBW65_19100 [Tumebacillus avium]|uniref:Uncharacterized protein n=1 Tax=Tumebacillus avium TaxID=1903704 RepID=A0A1Y0IQZ2_9BACL|nr:hypothetical protein [Tumebacillus avium]ARU62847.1 hypothetical protein CBW65_19100 [Tumebacillus avium]
MNLPLQIYDFIAVIFPAAMLLAILRTEIPSLPIWQQSYQIGNLAIMLIVSYILGQVIQLIARVLEKNKYTKWLFYRKERVPSPEEIELGARKSKVILARKQAQAILTGLSEFYGFPVAADEKGLFELVYAPVHDRLAKRDVFLALSNMMRALAMISFMYGFYLVVKIVISLCWGWQPITFEYWFLGISILSYFAFRKGYLDNKNFSEAIPYGAFLAWYQQQKLSKK